MLQKILSFLLLGKCFSSVPVRYRSSSYLFEALLLTCASEALPVMASANSKTSSDLFTRAEKSFPKKNVHLIYAHGIMACVAWVILIPFGAILIKIVPGRYAFWVHTIFQVAGLLAFWGAAAIGVWLSVTLHKVSAFILLLHFLI